MIVGNLSHFTFVITNTINTREPRTARFSEETKKFVGELQQRRSVADQPSKNDAEHLADEIAKAFARAGLREGIDS